MNGPENNKWEKMLVNIMTEGKRIKKRNTVIKTLSSVTIIMALAVSLIVTNHKNNDDFNREELLSKDLSGNEIEVALIATDAFFDEELEILIY